jgi:tetratricopeptide (TPR) repeat protein
MLRVPDRISRSVVLPAYYLKLVVIGGCLLGSASIANAQLITMSKECRASIDEASALLDSGEYGAALNQYTGLVEDCDTKDGTEAVQVGLARAHNGLQEYTEAIAAADVALENSKNTSINAYFEKALAEEKLGNNAAAAENYQHIIDLTEKNQNVAERATIYAKVANLNYRAGRQADADQYLQNAMQLDPDNPDYLIQRGDWAANDGDYNLAFENYDQAVSMGRTDADMYAIRSDARMQEMQKKYGTDNVQELRSKMTPEETSKLCADSKKALDLGLRDMQMDMFVALVCR